MKTRKRELKTNEAGTLYVVSTPIGNLEDITLRALNLLKDIDLIAAETVKHTRALCRHFGIKTKIISYNQHNRRVRGPELIKKLKSGRHIALVTNAGTPAISDPGVFLINGAIGEGIEVSPIPGPSALTAALSVSGIQSNRFLFLGFLSNKPGSRRKELKELISESNTLVLFEAPHRLKATLTDMLEILGDRKMVLHKELTKFYEDSTHGSISETIARLDDVEIKGEYTLVIAGKGSAEKKPKLERGIQQKIRKLLKKKEISTKDLARKIATEEGVAYRAAYKICLAEKKRLEATDK